MYYLFGNLEFVLKRYVITELELVEGREKFEEK